MCLNLATLRDITTLQIKMATESKSCDSSLGLNKYLKDGNLADLRQYLINKLEEESSERINLIPIAKVNNETATLIKELVNLYQIDEKKLANQICKEIVADIKEYVDLHLEKYGKFTLNSPSVVTNVSDSNAQFFNLLSLLKDVSILGRKLLESSPQFNALQTRTSSSLESSYASSSNPCDQRLSSSKQTKQRAKDSASEEDATSEDLLAALIESSSSDDFLVLTSSLESITTRDMFIAALIYIKIHECFTLSHDIQSVAMILRRTKFMILNILAPKDQMELIAKLLTSIGRYNEMNYVFDLFRDRNQFEILLGKGVEKTPELRIGLFNYVKKNPEFYPLVTLNFSMFREIAESLEACAIKRLNKVISAKERGEICRKETAESATSTSTTTATTTTTTTMNTSEAKQKSKKESTKLFYSKESLNLSLIELVDASDCFAKAGCYKRSNNCERKAKLIALHLALLPKKINLLDLQQSELNDLIVSFDSFRDAYIVAEAYDYHLSWRQALFRNVIQRCNLAYLHDYCSKYELSVSLVEELVLLYKQYVNSTTAATIPTTASAHPPPAPFLQPAATVPVALATGARSTGITAAGTATAGTATSNHLRELEESSRVAGAMRLLLGKLCDVELKCKIYSQLNFDDAKEELLRDPAIQAHLKDLKLA